MQKALCLVIVATLLICTNCTRPSATQTPLAQCLSYFSPRPNVPDTLHCFLAEATEGTLLSDTLLKTVLDSTQFESLHFGTGEARFLALSQFSFAKDLCAALLRTEESWFRKQTLLVFDLRQQKCLAVVELAHFYGGDGGQTASESWLFPNVASPKLFVKTAEHGFVTQTDDQYLREHGELLQWKVKNFHTIPNPDSVLFLRRFSMHRTW